jgi:pimeloyl-ACP methyl ester carboxylesterase
MSKEKHGFSRNKEKQMRRVLSVFFSATICGSQPLSAAEPEFKIEPVSGLECPAPCKSAIFFLHGFTGSPDATWGAGPSSWPTMVARDASLGTVFDVYQVRYTTSWFSRLSIGTIVDAVGSQLDAKMIDKKYERVVLIAHSLGGNIARNYLIHVALTYGHTALSRFPLAILLGTPMQGGELARISALPGASAQLRSLTSIAQNDYLWMLRQDLRSVAIKRSHNRCAPVFVLAGYEQAPTYGAIVVSEKSATIDATLSEGFSKNHIDLPKPGSPNDPVYVWVATALKECLRGVNYCTTNEECKVSGDFQ